MCSIFYISSKNTALLFSCNERRGARAGVTLKRVRPFSAHCVHCRHQTQKRSHIKKKKKQRRREGAAGGDDIMCTAAKMQPHKNNGLHSVSCHVTNPGSVDLFLDLDPWCLWMR